MRTVPAYLAEKLSDTKNVRANNSQLGLDVWISRPTIPLVNTEFLEKQEIAAGASDIAIAACHPVIYRPVTKLYAGYIVSGTAYIKTAVAREAMTAHVWTDTGFSETATAIALEFNGTMPKDRKGRVEFVTEEYPWVFWIDDGALYGRVLGTEGDVTLAAANATDVFAARGMWSDVGGFDFGLVVFYLLSGQLYYRQLIDGEWMDAEYVSSAGGLDLSALTLTSLAAMRTWDYRLVVQLRDSTGVMYEIFTQFMGIGKQNVEHLEIADVSTDSSMTRVYYSDAQESEHLEISEVTAGALYGGLYDISVPAIVDAYNIADESDDYGKIAVFVFDIHLIAAEVAAQPTAFTIVDENSVAYVATTATLGADGKTVTLTFADFNNSSGECEATYTPGTVTSMAGTALTAASKTFTPTGLVPSAVPAPTVVDIYNY